MTIKTDVSRFHVHDELTAPEGSNQLLKSIVATGGQIAKFLAVLSGSPFALRAYLKLRSQLRGGVLDEATRLRIALAVAERRGDTYSVAQHAGRARRLGLGLDEISRARSFTATEERDVALMALLEAVFDSDGAPPNHLHEEAREIGWTDEEILEAISHLALNEFQSLIANAAALPQDQSNPDVLPTGAS